MKMSKKETKKLNREKKKVEKLVTELKANDKILEKNHKDLRGQIQEGLYHLDYPVGSPWFDSMLEKMKLDRESVEITLKGLKVINPIFEFQTNPRWMEIQRIQHEKNVKALKENIVEIEAKVKQVKKSIADQNQRINARRIQIIDDLKDLKQDVSEYTGKTPDYIG